MLAAIVNRKMLHDHDGRVGRGSAADVTLIADGVPDVADRIESCRHDDASREHSTCRSDSHSHDK